MAAGRLAKQSLSAAQRSFAEGAVNVGSIIIDEGEAHVQVAGWDLVQ